MSHWQVCKAPIGYPDSMFHGVESRIPDKFEL